MLNPVMAHKKIVTRKAFEQFRLHSAAKMVRDGRLCREALNLLTKADRYAWIHQTTWMGEPILNLPQDMFALQEIIYRTRPEYIIEAGTAWGGSLLFYASLMEVLGGKKVVGVDIFIPPDLKRRVAGHRKLNRRISWIHGSSVEEKTVQRVRSILGNSRKVLVVLDSYHTQEHVLRELRLYSPFVGKGFYMVIGDTVVESLPVQVHRPRPWGPGNNPKTALAEFLKSNRRFKVDKALENKLLLTCNPGGYIQAEKD